MRTMARPASPVAPSPARPPAARRGLSLGAAFALLLGCSAQGPSGGAKPNPAGDGGAGAGDAAAPSRCAAVCARLAGATSCGASAVSTCEADCATLTTSPGAARCGAAVGALLDCAATAEPQCAGRDFPFAGCDAPLAAYGQCAAAPASDGGTTSPPGDASADECVGVGDCESCASRTTCGWCNGRCLRGTSRGPAAGSCGGDTWSWTTSTCRPAPPPDAGLSAACVSCAGGTSAACASAATACADDASCLACARDPGNRACFANRAWFAFLMCACVDCRSSCMYECSMVSP